MVRELGSVLIVTVAVLAIEFGIAYHVLTGGTWRRLGAWWDSEEGRHIMAFTLSIGVVAALWSVAVVARWLGRDVPPWFDWLRVLVFVTVPVVLAWRRRMLARAQRER